MNNIVLNKLSLIILSIALFLGAIFLGIKLLFILMPFIIAIVISKILQPILFILNKRLKIHRGIATLISVFLFISVSGFLLYALGNFLVTQLIAFSDGLPEFTDTVTSQMLQFNYNVEHLLERLPIKISFNMNTAISNIINTITGQLGTISAFLVGKAQSIPRVLVTIIVTFVASFFMTKDRDLIKTTLEPFFKSRFLNNKVIKTIKKDVLFVFGAYFKAQLILMSLTFLETSIGLTLIGVNYSIFIALGISLLDAIPIFGTGAVFIPWIIVKLFLGDFTMAFYLTIVYLIATLGRQSLEPKILSSQIGIHPLITLLSLYLGVTFFRFIGIILGPLTTISAIALYKAHYTPEIFSERL